MIYTPFCLKQNNFCDVIIIIMEQRVQKFNTAINPSAMWGAFVNYKFSPVICPGRFLIILS